MEPARLWGRTPKVFGTLTLLYGALDRRSSPIEPSLRTLVTVRVSQINWCSFCVDVNSATALKRGISEDKLLTIADHTASPLFTKREKAALAYCESITYTNRRPSEQDFASLRQHFNDDAIIELTALVAFQNLSSKFNAALQVPPQGFCNLSAALTSGVPDEQCSSTDAGRAISLSAKPNFPQVGRWQSQLATILARFRQCASQN